MTASRPRIQSLIFEVTQRCNHACLHCYNVWHGADGAPSDYPRGELDTERTLALLGKALDETACSHVTPTGGEPLLRGDLNAILDYLRGRNSPVTIISNGRLLGEAAAVDCLDRGVGLFELPLLSHRREIHDRLSGAPGAWDAVLDAMANVRLHRGRFGAAVGAPDAPSAEFGLPVSCSIPIQPCLIDTRAFPHIGFAYCAAGG